jgi:hypothetical protein
VSADFSNAGALVAVWAEASDAVAQIQAVAGKDLLKSRTIFMALAPFINQGFSNSSSGESMPGARVFVTNDGS